MTTSDDKSYTFSWHEQDRNESIWSWLIPVLMSAKGANDPIAEEIIEATDRGENCVITMQINGIEVDAEHVFERLVDNMRYIATREAARIVSEIPGFDELSDLIYNTQRDLKYQLRSKLQEMGLEVYNEED